MSDKIITIKNLKKNFGKHEVLKGINFSVKKGDIIQFVNGTNLNH